MALTLKPHQIETLRRQKRYPAWLNLGQMGVGKTITELVQIAGNSGKTIVVAPAYLTRNWLKEANKFFPEMKAAIYDGKSMIDLSVKCYILSYERMVKHPYLFRTADSYVFDEAHYLAHMKSQRTKTAHDVVRKYKPKRLALLSGSLLKNRVPDLYSPLRLCDYLNKRGFNKRFTSEWQFNKNFCYETVEKIAGRMITSYSGRRNVHELRGWLSGIQCCYRLADIGDIPRISHQKITIAKAGKVSEQELAEGWEEFVSTGLLVGEHISTLKKESSWNKRHDTIAFAVDVLKEEEQLVIFSDHPATAKYITELLREYCSAECIVGDTPMQRRSELVDKFQAKQLRVLVGSIGAMSLGVTLTSASVCIFNDQSWDVSQNRQAYGRVWRISQTKPVRVFYLTCEGVDDNIAAALIEKAETIDEVMGELK